VKNIIFLILIVAFPSLVWGTGSYQATVVGVTDGDTITVLKVGNEQVKIRLAGIDCPERKQPWGNKAKQAASDLVARQTVTIEAMGKDRYKRTIGRVYVDGVNVNRALVEAGHCWTYVKYAKDDQLSVLQGQAVKQRRGLWGLPEGERVEPWKWRKGKRN
jgi:micrococcal nuclease